MAHAATSTWSGTTNGTWDTTTAANWGGTAFTSGNNALFTGTPTNNVTTATGLTIGSITLDNTFTGSVTLTGGNTVNGATTINGGTLNLNANTGLGTSAVAIGSSGAVNVTLSVDGNVNNVFTGTGTITISGSAGAPNFNNASALNGFTGTLNINTSVGKKLTLNTQGGNIGSGAIVNLASTGTLYIAAPSTFSGITFNLAGTGNTENLGALRLESSAVIGSTSSVVLSGNTQLGGNTTVSTINAVISETGGARNVTKVGSGTMIFGGNNTYTGTTTISAGALHIGSGGTSGTLGSGAVTDNATLAFNRSDSFTVSNNIGGTGALTNIGAGTLTLTGANTYTGTTTIQGGTLNVGNGTSGSLGTSALTFSNSGTINFNKAAGSSQSMGALTFSAGAGATVQSTYGGSGNTSLTFSNVVARNAGASANFVVSGGTNGTTNKIVFTQVAGATPSTGTLLDRGYFFNGSSYAAYDTGGFVRAYGSGDTNYVTAAGANSIANTSTNNVALTGNVTSQASASINTLNMGANTLALDTGVAFKTNGILVSGNSASTISGGTSLAATTSGAELVVRVDGASDALDISTPIIANGTNAFTKTGAGTLTLSATGNAYTGTTTVNAGTLALSGTYTGGGALTVNAGATLSGSSSGTNTLGNFLVTGASSAATLTSGTYNVASTSGNTMIDNGGSLTVSGATLNINNVSGGFFPIGNTANTTSTVTLNSGAITVANNFGVELGRIGNGVLTINGGTFTENGSGGQGLILGEQATSGGGAQGGTVNLNGGTLVTRKLTSPNGANVFNFNGGTLQAGSTNGAASFWASSVRLTANVRNSGGTIDNNGTSITIAQPLVHSTISGDNATDGGMTFKGSSGFTTTLSGANTYTGATTVNSGTLKIASGGALNSSSSISVASGATLENANGGSITPALTLNEGAALTTSAASSAFAPTSLTLTGDLSDGWTAIALTASAGSGLTKSGALTLTLSGVAAGTYNLTSGSAFTGSFSSANINGNALSASGSDWTGTVGGFAYTYTNSTNVLNITAVPEPREFAIAITALLGSLIFARRRQARRCE